MPNPNPKSEKNVNFKSSVHKSQISIKSHAS